MRHRKDHRKLSRTASHRRAVLRNLVTALFQYERIETTVAKAKEARRLAERHDHVRASAAIVAARRHVARFVTRPARHRQAVRDDRALVRGAAGGYTRILRHRPAARRRGRDRLSRAGEDRRAEGEGAAGPDRGRGGQGQGPEGRSAAKKRKAEGAADGAERSKRGRKGEEVEQPAPAPSRKRGRTGVKTG